MNDQPITSSGNSNYNTEFSTSVKF